ncbi:MAG: M23 family metallopeptidase [Synechococcaceae cyanobacterium]|nr:M23 family metallopeptidase [Synechococcaceae cyanobacterium]
MKPHHFLLTTCCLAPLAAPLVAAIASDGFETSTTETLLAALPNTADRLWVRVRQSVTIEELSGQLNLDETRLAQLNDVDEDHQFRPGDWLVTPSQGSQRLRTLAALDTTQLRRTPPVGSPPPVAGVGVVQIGDTLMRIAQRYGITMADLLRFNPGLEAARLVAGSQVRLAQSAPGRSRMTLGLMPTGSGGLSWPELPQYGGNGEMPRQYRGGPQAGWVWPAQGVFTSGYGWRWGRMHKGIDVANNVGTPIVAAQRGRVTFSGWHDGGYGYLVEVSHEDGSRSLYAHNSRLLVQEGQEVEQGQTISLMGSTGRSTGPHLHFEIHPAGQGAANPLQYLPPRA